MAMKAMRCPQCGADLELDDTREFGFCSSCGTKIMLNETVHVKHSGSVKMDNSEQARNRLNLANRAFQSGNYKEAEEYYTRVLEDMPNDITSLYRKGICAIYGSYTSHIRTAELQVALSVAKENWDREWASLSQLEDEDIEKKNNLSNIQNNEDQELASMLTASMNSLGTSAFRLLSREACENQISKWTSLIDLFYRVTPYIKNEKVLNDLLNEIIDFCETISNTNISYKYGVKFDKNNKPVDQYSNISLSAQTSNYISSKRKEFIEIYNNLPYKQQARTELDNRIQELQSKVNELSTSVKDTNAKLKTAKTNFWSEHPDIKKSKSTTTLKFIGFGICEFIIGIAIWAMLELNGFLGLALLVLILVGAVLIVKTGFSKAKNMENEYFSTDIKTLSDALKSYKDELNIKQKELDEANKEMKAFMATFK